jgi:catechol 2,3-dioxygenase
VIDAQTSMGPVHLMVSDAERLSAFYIRHLGMRVTKSGGATVALGAGGRDLLVLSEDASATRAFGTTGLYHFALLVSSRAELARSLRHLVSTRTELQGAADHGVSEALYLADPDGNGIEIYRDRPRAEWPRVGGVLQMGVDPLDFEGLMSEPDGDSRLDTGADRMDALDPATVMGHVHLHVANLAAAEAFYSDVLGFDVMQRYGRGALFVSAGGYHHHVGLNTWAGVGLPPAPVGSLGLQHFTVKLAGEAAKASTLAVLREARAETAEDEAGILVRDPSGNALLLTT